MTLTMPRENLAIMGGVMVVFAGAFAPMEGKAFPFEATPSGFVEYLNSGAVEWDDNSQRHHYNPRKCKRGKSVVINGGDMPIYSCQLDFNTTTSLGRKTCINFGAVYSSRDDSVDVYPRGDDFTGECGEWESVNAPETQIQPYPESEPRNTEAIVQANAYWNPAYLVGLLLASLAVAFGAGFAFSKYRDRRKSHLK